MSLRKQVAGADGYCPVIHIPAYDRLRELGLFSLQKGRLQEKLRITFQHLKVATRELKRDYLQRGAVLAQGGMALS